MKRLTEKVFKKGCFIPTDVTGDYDFRVRYRDNWLWGSGDPGIPVIAYGIHTISVDPVTGKIINFEGYESHEYWEESSRELPPVSKQTLFFDPVPQSWQSGVGIDLRLHEPGNEGGTFYNRADKLLIMGKRHKGPVYRIGGNLYVHVKKGRVNTIYITGVES